MKPTHLDIIGRSKFPFAKEIADNIPPKHLSVIKKIINYTTIVLSDRVKSAKDVNGLMDYLVQKGLPQSDLRLRYPAQTGNAKLKSIIQSGLIESGISFGSDVAERDEGLDRYFISTKAYSAVANHKKHIIIAPKGSGKSAILREISGNDNATMTVTPEHYATEVLEVLNANKKDDDIGAYIATWKYTLLVEIFKQLVSGKIGQTKPLSEIRSYLASAGHLSNEMTMFERFVSYIRRITQVKGKFGPLEGQIGLSQADELGKLFKMDELLGLLPALNKTLRKNHFSVFIDELDQSWNNSETANKFLVSLLTAAIQIRGVSDNLHIIVFLRTEIFNLIKPNLPQLDKLRSDIENIYWTNKDLKNLIVSRAIDSLSITVTEDISANSAIKTIFPKSPNPNYENGFNYIVSRTSLRPREIIQFCNLALEESILLETINISPEAIIRAEEIFSNWKLDHIVAENLYIFPGLNEIFEYLRGTTKIISYNTLDSALTDIILSTEKDKSLPNWLCTGIEPQEFMQILYDIEIIGIEQADTATYNPQIPERHYDFSFRRPKGKPELSQTFLFHPGIWKALELI